MANVAKRPNGKWRARYRDDRGREHARHFERRIDAQKWLDDVTASKITGTYVDPRAGRITVEAWAGTWMEGRVALKPKTVASYRSLLDSQVLPRWKDVPLVEVRHGEAVAWIAKMQQSGLSASRSRQAYHLFKAMLDDAVKDGRLARNPISGIDLPRLPTKEHRYLTHDEVMRLADASSVYKPLILVLAYTGIRWGEATALRVKRVDLLRGRLRIAEAVTEINGVIVEGTPKAHASRTVPIPKFVRDVLAPALEGLGPQDLVFRSPQGSHLRVANFRRRVFDPAVKAAGLEALVPHSLRHTAASLAISSGASVKATQEMLGHSTATLTLDLYGHLFPDELDAVAERLDGAAAEARADRLRTATVSKARSRRVGGGKSGL